MRRLRFVALRTRRSARIRWLDWHNLLGIATAGYLFLGSPRTVSLSASVDL